MPGRPRSPRWFTLLPLLGGLLAGFAGCAATPPPAAERARVAAATPPSPGPERVFPVMLGIDVLEANGFDVLRGKRVGLLTHPAGVNRRGESTIQVLRRAPQVNLVALFGPEHGIYGDQKAEIPIEDAIDPRTGLPVYSLYGKFRKPTPKMLAGLDALVVDLQDIGTRSYTFVSSMLYTMAACFENDVELVVLDRPNPLGGLKVDGPPLDAAWKSYVGAFRVPYVHGLTIGELARLAKEAPGVLTVANAINVPEEVRLRGRLTIVPMRGWQRGMRWPETGLTFVPTSTYIRDFAAAVGYPMTGLGTYIGGFSHGIGSGYPFRGIAHPRLPLDALEKELNALNLPGLAFRRVPGTNRQGRAVPGLYIEITDYDAWNPTELSFHMMRLAARIGPGNPFATAPRTTVDGFIKHVGSEAFYEAIARDGGQVNIEAFLAQWRQAAAIYQQQSRRYWIYR